jgi:hypothetical protein
LIFLAGISFFLDLELSNHKNLYEANVQEITPFVKESEANLEGHIVKPQGIILRFPKNTNNEIINQTIRKDFPNIKITDDNWIVWDSPKGKNITASYNEKGEQVLNSFIYKISWSGMSHFLLIFAYPLYLVVRFIMWAIVTLKEKKEINM